MWALTEAGLCTMNDLRTTLTLDDYLSAFMYLQSKREAEQQAMQQARGAVVMN